MQPQQQAGLPDPDLALTDPKEYQAQLTNYIALQNMQTLAQAAGPVYAQLATQSREMSKNDPKNAEIWRKYGSDIDTLVANVPAHMRTKELYDKAVVQVRGERFDELAAEKAAALAAANTGLARASADAGAPIDEGSADIWQKIESTAMGAAALKVAGKQGILTAIRKGAYKSLEDYAATVAKSRSKVDPASPNIVFNRRGA